jgi:hypothetical protein
MVVAVQGSSANLAPVTRIDSPSTMIMKSPQRSAMCAPSTSQSAVVERPRPGVQKLTEGETYSMARAASHRAKRHSPCDSPPAIQSTPDRASQDVMR